MRRLRYLLLSLITAGFAIGIGASLVNNERGSELAATRIQLSAWSLAQLEHEFLRFHTSIRLFQVGDQTAAHLQLDYDLLWNRLETFLYGSENQAIRQRFDAENIARDLLTQLQRDEALLFSPELRPGPQIAELVETYSQYQHPIRQLIINNFTGLEAARIVDELNKHFGLTQLLLLGLLFCGGGLSLMLFLESKRNNFLAHNDVLTGMPNRQSILALQRKKGTMQFSAIAVIEMNNFRAVNEHLSHDAGDQLLRRIGDILNALKPRGSFIARVGGDEFIMSFAKNFPSELVINTLQALDKALQFDLQHNKQIFQIRSRIGVVLNAEKLPGIEHPYYCATLATRELRLSHRQGIRVYDDEINSRYLRSRLLLSDLRQALAGSFPGLSLEYQPIIGLKQPTLGVEALLRWRHPGLGMIAPQEVVDLAENNQLGSLLERWLFQQLKLDLLKIPGKMREKMYFSLNIAPSQFSTKLPSNLSSWLIDTPLRPEQLILEMTESIAVINFSESQCILQAINALGIDIALDDFGTGYSSLSYLSGLQVQRIKIDKSFVCGISDNLQLQRVVRSIVELCHGFNFSVICEGIENSRDDQQIRALGADYAQGYFYGKPMPPEALIIWSETCQALPIAQDQD